MNTQIDIEVVNNKVDELNTKEISEDLFIQIYTAKDLATTETENSNQLVKLLKNEVDEYKLSNQTGKIFFDEFIYVNTIGFYPAREGKFELRYTNLANDSVKLLKSQVNDKGRVVFAIHDTVSSISIKYERDNLFSSKSLKIKDFWIFGLNFEAFNKEVSYLKTLYDDRAEFTKEFQELKAQLQKGKTELNQKKEETDQYISEKEALIEELSEKIEELDESKTNLRTSIQQLESQKETLESQLTAKNSELERLTKNNESLKKINIEVDKELTQLKLRKEELAAEVNLVPDNLIGFNQRTSESKRTYYWLCTIPLVMLSILFYCAWSNITKFSSTEGIKTLEQAYVLLIQRLPLTFLIITMVSILVALLYKMLRHLMEIQQQELSLSKISVLARDVADSEYQHLPENEKQEHRIKHKMQLIREYFNSEFERHKEFIKNEKNEDMGQSINIPSQLRNLAKFKK
ncbi:coiled-coil domain-containing protein [Acinetobacter lwoffii]|uniref:coiled-coil domain-containing protein n=1 Tax=Acinetobacter lwoffii TaxID=28090 RepID=UPI003BF6B306